MNTARSQAVIIGGSMAGLLAARVLSDHYEQVTLIERDAYPAAPVSRKSVPQGRHAHALLARGLQIMEAYFPGLTDHLAGQGANVGDVSQKVFWYFEGGQHRRVISGIEGISVSRPLLEATVRERVLALPNVRMVEACDVLGLLSTADRARITGVRLIRRNDGSAEESLPADLVVDAGGRGSRSPAWLEQLGYERPAEERVNIGITYTTCHYRRRPDHAPGYNVLLVETSPENRRGGALMGQEGNRWLFTAIGHLDEPTRSTHAEILEHTRRLDSPVIFDVLNDAEPLDDPITYKIPVSLRRRYDRLARFPQGYLIIGDALCGFNPVYGQGMSVAALESVALDKCLRQGSARLAQRYFKATAAIIDLAWSMAVESDLRFPEIEGRRSGMTRFNNWYISKLHHAAHSDAVVSVAFLRVLNMLEPPLSLMHPRIVWRVMRGNLRRSRVQSVDPVLAESA